METIYHMKQKNSTKLVLQEDKLQLGHFFFTRTAKSLIFPKGCSSSL